MKFFDCGAGKKAFYKIENMNTGPDDFVLIAPWPVATDSNSARRMNAPKLSINRIFTVLNTVYLVEAPKWETFNTSQILLYSLPFQIKQEKSKKKRWKTMEKTMKKQWKKNGEKTVENSMKKSMKKPVEKKWYGSCLGW